jgi:hypothetical protein
MTEPVPAHRRRGVLVDLLTFSGCLLALPVLIGLLSLTVVGLNHLLGRSVRPVTCLVFVVVVAAVPGLRAHRQLRAAGAMAGWVATGGWEPVVDRPWPWQGLVRWPDTVTVLRAYGKRVEGFPVVTGELRFQDNGLGTSVDRRDGRAAFAVVTLPQPAPSMAVRVHREPARRRRGEDEFRRRFHPVGADSHRLDRPELRAAHVRGDIPPWTLLDDELFAFVPLTGPLRPDDLEETARRAIRVVLLLDVGVDGLAVEVGEDG